MRVWVTGANGLLGSALQRALKNHGIDHVGTTREQVDVTDLVSLSHFYQKMGPFTHVIHCAAFTHVDLAESQSEEVRKLNALSPALIGSLAEEHHFRMVHISTDYVFGGQGNKPLLETDRIGPQTIYGQTKAEGELHLLTACPNACIIRSSWLFGCGERHFVAKIMRLMLENEEVSVVADQKGRPTYAPDLADALIAALDWSGVYHIANSGITSWHAFAEIICAEALSLNLPIRCRFVRPIMSKEFPAAANRPLYSALDTTKADQKLGAPLRSWREGLKEYLRKTYATS